MFNLLTVKTKQNDNIIWSMNDLSPIL